MGTMGEYRLTVSAEILSIPLDYQEGGEICACGKVPSYWVTMTGPGGVAIPTVTMCGSCTSILTRWAD